MIIDRLSPTIIIDHRTWDIGHRHRLIGNIRSTCIVDRRSSCVINRQSPTTDHNHRPPLYCQQHHPIDRRSWMPINHRQSSITDHQSSITDHRASIAIAIAIASIIPIIINFISDRRSSAFVDHRPLVINHQPRSRTTYGSSLYTIDRSSTIANRRPSTIVVDLINCTWLKVWWANIYKLTLHG